MHYLCVTFKTQIVNIDIEECDILKLSIKKDILSKAVPRGIACRRGGLPGPLATEESHKFMPPTDALPKMSPKRHTKYRMSLSIPKVSVSSALREKLWATDRKSPCHGSQEMRFRVCTSHILFHDPLIAAPHGESDSIKMF
jgi:hypothetical protein